MSKILLLTDTHIGCRNGHQVIEEHILKFHEHIIQVIKDNSITTIIHLGDLFDNRISIPIKAWNNYKTRFLDEIRNLDIQMYVLIGNHDTVNKTNNDLNSLHAIIDPQYNNIHIIDKPTHISIENTKFLLCPWFHNSHHDECVESIENSTADVFCGHLELSGFIMHSGIISINGLESSIFDHFNMVLSGHYHAKSSKGNITYLGTGYDMSWGDIYDKKYYHLFDTEQIKLIPYEYTNKLFHRIVYNDSLVNYKEIISTIRQLDLTNRFVKLIVRNKENPMGLEEVINIINKSKPFELSIVDETVMINTIDDSYTASEDVTTTINKTIMELEDITEDDKDTLKVIMGELYQSAIYDEVTNG